MTRVVLLYSLSDDTGWPRQLHVTRNCYVCMASAWLGLVSMPPNLTSRPPPLAFLLLCQVRGKFSEDGVWYDAVIESITDGKYLVVYEGFGNSEELSLGHLELKNAPRGCPGNPLDPPHADDLLWYVLVGCDAPSACRVSRAWWLCMWCRFVRCSKLSDEELLERLTQTEREAAVASGKDYAQRPSGYKRMLTMKMDRCVS